MFAVGYGYAVTNISIHTIKWDILRLNHKFHFSVFVI